MTTLKPNAFHLRFITLPLCMFITTIALLEYLKLDLVIADYLYQMQGSSWMFKDFWIFSQLLHTYARQLMLCVLAALAIVTLVSWRFNPLKPYSRAFCYLLLSAISSAVLVSIIKQVSNFDCPWDLARYGGSLEYFSLLQIRPDSMPPASCFPGGHASAGYAWLGLFFIAHYYKPHWRWYCLASVIALGVVYGGVQQLRGAHFISHDIWTLAICWFNAALWYTCFYHRNR